MHAVLRGIDCAALFFPESDRRMFLAALEELADVASWDRRSPRQ